MDTLIKALKAAGETTRLRILAALSQHELTVSELVSLLGQSQPRVSRHLKLLLDAGLLLRFQEGSWVFHRLSSSTHASEVAQSVLALIDFDDPQVIKDSERLARIKAESAKRATDYFAQNAGDWDKIRTMVGSDTSIETAMLKVIAGNTYNSMIDMGTGTGRILQIFSPHVQHATGYDSSQEMLKLARANIEQAKLKNCQVRLGDISALPDDKASADLITIHQVMHYLDRPFAVIEEAKRLLAKQGKILIIDFAAHQHEFLRTEHAHRRLGFANNEVAFWCESNDLKLIDTQKITHNNHKDSLDVMLWVIEHQ
ncbi:MAG: metalloregulator ArsR/SmtB family transcription factor [Arenicellales bacterium]